jgi:hypothetical protein
MIITFRNVKSPCGTEKVVVEEKDKKGIIWNFSAKFSVRKDDTLA